MAADAAVGAVAPDHVPGLGLLGGAIGVSQRADDPIGILTEVDELDAAFGDHTAVGEVLVQDGFGLGL
jgi:hypothetical protein